MMKTAARNMAIRHVLNDGSHMVLPPTDFVSPHDDTGYDNDTNDNRSCCFHRIAFQIF